MKAKVVVTDQAFGGTLAERAVAERHDAEFAEFQCATEAETVAAVAGAHVVFVNLAPVTRAVLERMAPGATVIRYGVGYDNVDVRAAGELGISVANVPDYGSETVADHTVALLLSSLRKLSVYDSRIREDGWIKPPGLGTLRGFGDTTVGLIGTGRIGFSVAKRLMPFGFRIIAHDPWAPAGALTAFGIESVELDDLLSRSHAVSLHCPLTPNTHHLIDDAALARMSEGAVLINTSRGGLVDEDALVRALKSGRLSAVGLDVFSQEPLPPESPLRALDQVTLTPHSAFYSAHSVEQLQLLAAEEADRALGGRRLRSPVSP
ncbi:C-terminal binding protein [Streptomyces malaysiensis]|uniref:C-terminal binding protein n=1 Tax=Streptomyces malaysiensis TaxID=92644 RepID=UPI00371C21E7